MYSLFNLMPEKLSGVLKIPGWNYLHDGLRRNLDAVITYYRSHSMAVESDHFLVRLLQSIDIPKSQNIERYADNVDLMSLNLSMALKMTSSIYRGQVFDGVFYGPKCQEILIAHNEPFDPFEADKNWQNQMPIQVLRHPITDLGMRLPDGNDNSTDFGIAVILINIPLLAVMYRAFRRYEDYLFETQGESQRSVMQFVHMYVLPNMMPSHVDQVVFNRLHALQRGAPLGEVRRPHSFPVVSYEDRLNIAQRQLLVLLEKQGKDFRGVMQEIPMICDDNLDQLMVLPKLAPTQQVMWALSISRLPALDFLFRASKDGANQRNRKEVQYVLRNIRMYRRNSMMKVLPPDMRADVDFEMEQIEGMGADANGM
jgi:hypothetical protein